MKEFVKLDKYGQIYIDKILFESYFPIIFTCINDNRDVFIVVCCQNNEKGCKWLLGKTNGISIVRMLRDEITVRQLLLECSTDKVSVDYVKNEYAVSYNDSDWGENSLYLPKEDSYMYAEYGEFEEEIEYFSSIDYHLNYNAKCYKRLEKTLETVNKGIEPIADALTILASAIGNISISSELVTTMEVFGELCNNLVISTEKYTANEKYKSVYNGTFSMSPDELSIKVESDVNNYADAA